LAPAPLRIRLHYLASSRCHICFLRRCTENAPHSASDYRTQSLNASISVVADAHAPFSLSGQSRRYLFTTLQEEHRAFPLSYYQVNTYL
jgi:hypothetical protein